MTWRIEQADCIEAMRELDEASVDAIVTDPPYGLEFMGKEWDRLTSDMPRHGTGESNVNEPDPGPWGRRERINYGGKQNRLKRCRGCGKREFSGSPCQCAEPDWEIETPERAPSSMLRMQRWHGAWATEALRVLKPGGHLLAFGGTRTYHRLACAVEDAGFEIRDSLLWLYGSGFPKSLDVSKAIDKAAGADREVKGSNPYEAVRGAQKAVPGQSQDVGYRFGENFDVTAPATPEAAQWEGWGTALKPAHEIVVCAQKPAGEADTIRRNLWLLAEQLKSLASDAANDSESRPAELSEVFASAEWTADEQRNTRDALCEAMGTSQFESALTSSLNIVSSWNDTLDALCELTSTFTTGTGSGTTTALRTLKSSLSDLTPRTMLQAATNLDGSAWNALPAARAFAAVESRLRLTRELLAPDPVTSESQDSSPDEAVPSHEPIVVARKPLVGTVAQNVLEYGTGALNIDASRIGTDDLSGEYERRDFAAMGYGGAADDHVVANPGKLGRWPPNVALSHLPECERVGTREVKGDLRETGNGRREGGFVDVGADPGDGEPNAPVYGGEQIPAYDCAPGCPVAGLDAQSGELGSPGGPGRQDGYEGGFGGWAGKQQGPLYLNESGGASRFFYTAKASRAERNAGLESAHNGKICLCRERPDLDDSPPRDISEPIEEDDNDSSTTGSGSSTTDQSPRASKSTIGTATRRTIESRTSNSSAPSITSVSTPGTTAEPPTGAGSATVRSAAAGSPPPPTTSTPTIEAGFSTDAADPATSAGSSRTSSAATCPDCGGVKAGALRNAHPT